MKSSKEKTPNPARAKLIMEVSTFFIKRGNCPQIIKINPGEEKLPVRFDSNSSSNKSAVNTF